jgi:flavin reductase (DIM6/NTAB) family NADH-FMN oxidoreductase RutF
MPDDAFAAIVDTLDAPMLVVTARAGGERSGCLVGFGTQCSINPRRWLVCMSKTNHTFGVAAAAQTLVVHFLRADQRDLAELFGSQTEDSVDKFTRCAWRDGPEGVPILAGCDWIAGHILQRIDLGDHEGQQLEVFDAGHEHEPAPQLGFQAVRGLRSGHAP